MNIIDLYWRGGPVMHFILLCSVLGLGFLFERFWFLWRTRADAEEVLFGIRSLLREQKIDDAIVYAQSLDVPIGRVVAAILIKYKEAGAGANLQRAAEEAALREAPHFERLLPWISLIAGTATLLGLTGTVTGMISAFGAIAHSNLVTPQLVAGGVNEALLTTAFGLFVAVPMTVGHRFIQTRIDARYHEIERATVETLNLLEGRR